MDGWEGRLESRLRACRPRAARIDEGVWRKARHWRRRRVAYRWAAMGAAAVILAAAGLGLAAWLTRSPPGFDAARERIRQARSVAFEATLQYPDGRRVEGEVAVLASGLVRQRLRDDGGGVVTTVGDLRKGEAVVLDAAEGTARLTTLSGPDGGQRGSPLLRDWLGVFRSLAEVEGEALGRRQVEGERAWGFRVKREAGSLTVWVGEETQRLVDGSFEATVAEGKIDGRRVAFDVALDRSLFRLVPPPGYRLVRGAGEEGRAVRAFEASPEKEPGGESDARLGGGWQNWG